MPLNLSLAFHGAARTTTGSRHLLTLDDKQILLDCGLYQGRRKDTFERNLNFGFDPKAVHTAVLSHAHIDHSGNLPNLVKQGFPGNIVATQATQDLCRSMLRDSAMIQERDAEWLNRKRKKKGDEPFVPLYTVKDAEKCLEQFTSIPYHRGYHLLRDLRLTFLDAGHILGSASLSLEIRRGDQDYRLAFSGDIGRPGSPLLREPEVPEGVDWLIMEGTYGARAHAGMGEAKEELRATIERVARRGGRVIVPSFSVERTQEIVYYLNQLFNEGALPPIPIFVDSPLATDVTEIFRLHTENFNERVRKALLADEDLFGFTRLTYTRSVGESKRLNELSVPFVVISASGMCEGGRVRHHLRNALEDSKNCILFAGYQAEGTLGRQIVERKPTVNIFGEPFNVRAEIVTLNTMSGHADKDGLFAWAKGVKESGPLKRIFLVHGETTALETLGARLQGELGVDVVIPSRGESHALEG